MIVDVGGGDGGDDGPDLGVLRHLNRSEFAVELRRLMRRDLQDLVCTATVGGRDVERAVGSHHRCSQPGVLRVEFGHHNFAQQGAVHREVKEPQRAVLERCHR